MTPTEEILAAYMKCKTITGTHRITGYNWQKIGKTLSTYGIVANDTQALILDLYDKGFTVDEIAKRTGFARSTVNAYLPRVRPAYSENPSVNAVKLKERRMKNKCKENVT